MKAGLGRRLTVLVTLLALVAVAALTAGFNLALRSSLDADASRLVEARAQAAAEAFTVTNGRIGLRDDATEPTPDAQVWVYSGGRRLERPATASSTENALARTLGERGSGELEDAEGDFRLTAVPLRDGGGAEAGTLVSAIALEPYERTANRALVASIAFAAAIVVLIGVLTRLVVGRALRPVARMTADAADWSEHDLDRRFSAGEPSDELTQLAATFDGMLDRMAATLRHEKRFSAEVSHELRTPLSSIAAEAELALRRDRNADDYRNSLARISGKAAELTEILEMLLLAAREESALREARAEVGAVANQAIDSLSELADACGIRVQAELPEHPVLAGVEPATLRRIMTPLIENGCAYGRSSVRVNVSVKDETVSIVVDDDGPGIDSGQRGIVFTPGARGAGERNPAAPAGTGLGLSLARRLAHAVGGEIELLADAPSTRFEIRLPVSR